MDFRARGEISVPDLFHYLLKKWRSVIVCMLICAIMGGFYGYFVPPKEEKETFDDTEVVEVDLDSAETRVEYAQKLNDTEKEEVYRALQTYFDYKKTYDTLQTYYNESILMQIDATKEPTILITYGIDFYSEAGEQLATDVGMVDNIVTLYRNAISDQSVIDEIRAATGWTLDDSYIKELYGIGRATNNLVHLSVVSMTQEDCETIAIILENKIASSIGSVRESYSHSIRKVGRTFYEVNNTSRIDAQKAKSDSIASTENAMLAVKNALNISQRTYYSSLLGIAENYMDDDGVIDIQKMISSETIEAQEEMAEPLKRAIRGDAILTGLLIGLIFVLLWHISSYVFSTKLKSGSDVSAAFGMRVLGGINMRDQYRGVTGIIDKYIDRAFYGYASSETSEEIFDRISFMVGSEIEKKDLHKTYVTGVNSDSGVEICKQKVSEEIAKVIGSSDGSSVFSGRSPINDLDSLKELSSSDAVVLVEKLGVTRYSDIAKIMNICTGFGTKILGVVIVY